MNDLYLVIRDWREDAENRRQKLLESMVRGLSERDYWLTCGAVREIDLQLAHMKALLTTEDKLEVEREG